MQGKHLRLPNRCKKEERGVCKLHSQLIRSGEQLASTWSGGTTTQLTIFPAGASYANRDFQWRLSTATVQASASTFTALPGFKRLLMVLSGQMTLAHQGHHQVTLNKSEQDQFSGAWTTLCHGTGQDFNLMLAEGWQGRLQFLPLPDQSVWGKTLDSGETAAFYCFSGRCRFSLSTSLEQLVDAGDFLLLPNDSVDLRHVQVKAEKGLAELVYASIWYGRSAAII